MTNLRSILRRTISTLALVALAAPAIAADYVVAVPGALSRDHARQINHDLIGLVMETAAPGDAIRVVDATTTDTIATFAIPEGGEARIANLRRRALAGGLSDWNSFVRTHYINTTDPDRQGAILLPQLLTHLATQTYAHLNPEDREVCVLVAGSALYRDPREPSFDMAQARFPSDGLILAPQSRSPYGTADLQANLKGFYIHMLSLDDTWTSDLYQLRVQRAWQLLIEAQGGAMPTFTSDAATALQRFTDCERKPGRTFAWDSSRAMQAMLTVDRIAKIDNKTKIPDTKQQKTETNPPQNLVTESSIDHADETGRFGKVIRVARSAFLPDAGLITFHEVRLLTRNPVYSPADYGGKADGITVVFGGYFDGQSIGNGRDCSLQGSLSGCVLGTASDPLRLDVSSPFTFTANDGSNPESPSLTGSPAFNGPVSMVFDRDVAGVGLEGGYFDIARSTAIRAFDRAGNLIGGIMNIGSGMEYLALVTDDGSERIAGLQFSIIGKEPRGYGIDNVSFAVRSQIGNQVLLQDKDNSLP